MPAEPHPPQTLPAPKTTLQLVLKTHRNSDADAWNEALHFPQETPMAPAPHRSNLCRHINSQARAQLHKACKHVLEWITAFPPPGQDPDEPAAAPHLPSHTHTQTLHCGHSHSWLTNCCSIQPQKSHTAAPVIWCSNVSKPSVKDNCNLSGHPPNNQDQPPAHHRKTKPIRRKWRLMQVTAMLHAPNSLKAHQLPR